MGCKRNVNESLSVHGRGLILVGVCQNTYLKILDAPRSIPPYASPKRSDIHKASVISGMLKRVF